MRALHDWVDGEMELHNDGTGQRWRVKPEVAEKRAEAKRRAELEQAQEAREAAEANRRTSQDYVTGADLGKTLEMVADVVGDELRALQARVKQLEAGSGSAEKIAELMIQHAELRGEINVLKTENTQLRAMCEANKRHVSNVESKLNKARPWSKELDG